MRAGCLQLRREEAVMAEPENEQEQPCLHCMMIEIDRRLLRRISACPGQVRQGQVDTEEADEVIEATDATRS
jgi:hypothetical protein